MPYVLVVLYLVQSTEYAEVRYNKAHGVVPVIVRPSTETNRLLGLQG